MFSFPFNSTNSKRLSSAVAFAAILCLGSLHGYSQSTPAAKLQPDHYYLNGKPSTKQEIEGLDPKTIASVNVLKGKQAVDYTHDTTTKGVILVQTK